MSEELPLEEKPRWAVVPIYYRQTKEEKAKDATPVIKHHALSYEGIIQDTAKGEADVERLRATARFCNLRKLVPRARVECIADMPAHPVKPLSRAERAAAAAANAGTLEPAPE